MNTSSKKTAVKKLSAILASLTAAFGLTSTAQALEQPNVSAVEKVWDYTRNLNSVDGYRAFIAAHSDNADLTKEARSRAIALLSEFDLGDTFLSSQNVSSSIYSGSEGYQTASTGDFKPPYGARKWTLPEVLVDVDGTLVNEAGAFVTPQGQVHRSAGSYRITSDGKLLTPAGVVMATDVGVVPHKDGETVAREAVVGKLSIRDRDMSTISGDRAIVSTSTGRIIETPRDTARAAAFAARQARAQAQNAGIASAGTTGSYGG